MNTGLKKRFKFNRILSLALAICLAFGCMPITSAFAAETKIELPPDDAWTILDADLKGKVLAAGDKEAFGPYNGLSGYGNWVANSKAAKYTHNGKEYAFTEGFQAGSGNAARRSFIFTPKQACIVTVAYSGQAGRPMFIYQGNKLLASGEAGVGKDGIAPTITADIDDPSAGDVYIYGGSSNKHLFGIFADYYDPNVIVNRKVSGKIDYSGSADVSNVKVVFTDTKDQNRYEVPLTGTYSADIRQSRNYDISIEENGVVSEKLAVTLDTKSLYVPKEDVEFNIKVVDIALTKVTGDVVVHNIVNDGEYLDLSNVKLMFTAKDDPAFTYDNISIDNNKFEVEMMPNHEYEIAATGIDGYALSKLSQSYVMAAGDDKPFKNILLTETVADVEFKSEITVGADKEYAKVGDAITAIKAMKDRPAGEKGRVSVLIDPGTYVEQVIVDVPYVTLKAADENNRPTITFYYGIGYLYYSAGDNQYYSEDYAVQKTRVSSVTRWGCTVRVTEQNFIAENIIFENSFSCRVTPEELADGVKSADAGWYQDVSGKPERTTPNYDAKSKNAVERAAAFAGDANNWELYNCDFISSQDTFYTGKNGYVKNCYIEGATDYIFGGNSVVFEDCTLAWHGYSNEATGGYITACQTSDVPKPGIPDVNANGYFLKNCTVTNSKYYPENKFAAGSWGRNWGGDKCQVVFQGITIADGVNVPGAWSKMGGELSTSILYVDDVKKADGTVIDVSSTVHNPNKTMAENKYTVMDPTDYFGASWIPSHYTGEKPVLTEYTTTWNFGKANGAPDYAHEGTADILEIAGTTNAERDMILKVDVSNNGKFSNKGRTDEWAQVNDGTTFTIPAYEGTVITFDAYNADGTLTIGETSFKDSESYTVGAGVTEVTAVANGVGYMSFISTKTPADSMPDVPGPGPDVPGPDVPSTLVPGDFDGKNGVTVNDASLLMQYVLDNSSSTFADYAKVRFDLADVDGDKKLTAKDASMILKKAMLQENFEFSRKDWPSEDESDDDSSETTTSSDEATTASEDNSSETSTDEPVETTTSGSEESPEFNDGDGFAEAGWILENHANTNINLAHTDDIGGNATEKIHISDKATFKKFNNPISSGKAVFETDIYTTGENTRTFRIYLENDYTPDDGNGKAAVDVLPTTNIFYHLTDLVGGTYVIGSDKSNANASTDAGAELVGQIAANKWHRVRVEIDFDAKTAVTSIYMHGTDGAYNPDGISETPVGTVTQALVPDKGEYALKQIRLVRTAAGADAYFDNVSVSIAE